MPAPAFSAQAVINEEFHLTSLADYEGQWLVLLFYPFDFTFVCPTEVSSSCWGMTHHQPALVACCMRADTNLSLCNMQLVAFSEASKEFASVGAKVRGDPSPPYPTRHPSVAHRQQSQAQAGSMPLRTG